MYLWGGVGWGVAGLGQSPKFYHFFGGFPIFNVRLLAGISMYKNRSEKTILGPNSMFSWDLMSTDVSDFFGGGRSIFFVQKYSSRSLMKRI